MTIDELRDEYRARGIDFLILGEVKRTAESLMRKYDPRIYAGVNSWRDGREDLVQGVVTEMLLEEGQLDYIFAQAVTLEDFRALLYRQAQRYLVRKRQRTVIDNLLDRADEILRESPFVSFGSYPTRYRLDGSEKEARAPTDSELAAAARFASVVPCVLPRSTERAPKVYSRDNLEKLLVIVADRLPSAFSKNDLHRIFELLLTDWVPSFLEEVEEDQSIHELSPEDEVQVNEAYEQILSGLRADEAVILRAQVLKLPDRSVADELGTSRQTVIARRQRLLERLQPVLSGLPAALQIAVIERVSVSLTMPGEESAP